MLFWIFTATCVRAIELGGFDIDMGTGSFEDDSGWNQEETTGGTNDHDSNENWSNADSSWNTGGDSSGTGNYITGDANIPQSETDWNDFASSDPYEASDNTNIQNDSSETARAAAQQNNNDAFYQMESIEQQNSEDQISTASTTPIPSPTVIQTTLPAISPASTPVPEIQKNILTVPQKEEELTEERCRQKMQLIYCRKEIQNAEKVEIIPDQYLAIAVISVRINGKEADWCWRGNRILVEMDSQEKRTEIEALVMCRKELSWTEAKKNAILTYNIF